MQSIYFTALICYLPLRQNPPKTNQQQKTKKKNTNPSLTPPRPSPTPIHSLNICQLIQNISFAFSLKPVILITQGGREGRKEGGGAREGGGGIFFFKNASMPTLYVHEASPPHLTRWKQILKTNKSEASWHGLNDCIVKMIFGLLTDGVTTRTRAHTDSLTS